MAATSLSQKAAAEAAIASISLSYDATVDLGLKYCKTNSPPLITIDRGGVVRDLSIPGGGGICVRGVPKSIECHKGDRSVLSSDVLPFQRMSELFNQELSLSGKIPTGHFNSAFLIAYDKNICGWLLNIVQCDIQ